jgi:hypothetical protein
MTYSPRRFCQLVAVKALHHVINLFNMQHVHHMYEKTSLMRIKVNVYNCNSLTLIKCQIRNIVYLKNIILILKEYLFQIFHHCLVCYSFYHEPYLIAIMRAEKVGEPLH